LPILSEHHLLPISQEAITNAIRHGHAKHIFIDLQFDLKQVRLQISDDGGGFAAEDSTKDMTSHFGLLGMKERTEKIGGVLRIVSRPNSGTQVEVKVLVPRDSSDHTHKINALTAEPTDSPEDPPTVILNSILK
jgi:signal transduction histidine kinase